jgi:hypothetical protein
VVEIEERLAMLKQIENVAALAGLKGVIDNDGRYFSMGIQTTEGRGQRVYLRPSGKTPDGKAIVTLYSPARTVAKGMFSGMSKDQALELLRMNENTYFARFGIWENEKESMIVASTDMLLETMDSEELKAQAFYVAFAADAYEKKHGADQY